jgi:hypothetical protein
MNYIDMTGKVFGDITVIRKDRSANGVYWLCECACGNKTVVSGRSLRFGSTKSCGCGSIRQARLNSNAARIKKMVGSPHSRKLKDLRSNILDRCFNPANKRWNRYGGRGISVCDEWVANGRVFYKWCLENGYEPGLQIDRINVHGNYEPNNCRFVTAKVQQRNTTRNRLLTWDGQTMPVSQWAEKLGVRGQALQHRVDRGWDIKRIFTQKFRGRN